MKNISNKNLGYLLAAVTILLFLGYYAFFIDENYYKHSVFINAFILPLLYSGTVIVALFLNKKAKNNAIIDLSDDKYARNFSFSEAFQTAFIPMLIGGFISLSFIFLFFNYVDVDAAMIFSHQRLDSYLENAKGSNNYKLIYKTLTSNELRNENFFSLKNWSIGISLLLFFYLLLSALLGMFFRSTKQN